jgi:hypothetical protein
MTIQKKSDKKRKVARRSSGQVECHVSLQNYHETKYQWDDKTKSNNCVHCGKEVKNKYIVTGHDHTDYSYSICNCMGAKKHGKRYDQLT